MNTTFNLFKQHKSQLISGIKNIQNNQQRASSLKLDCFLKGFVCTFLLMNASLFIISLLDWSSPLLRSFITSDMLILGLTGCTFITICLYLFKSNKAKLTKELPREKNAIEPIFAQIFEKEKVHEFLHFLNSEGGLTAFNISELNAQELSVEFLHAFESQDFDKKLDIVQKLIVCLEASISVEQTKQKFEAVKAIVQAQEHHKHLSYQK